MDQGFISVPTTLQPTFAMGTPVKLFDLGEEFLAPATPSFDVSRDRKRFLMVRSRSEGSARSTARWVLVQNWRAEFTPR